MVRSLGVGCRMPRSRVVVHVRGAASAARAAARSTYVIGAGGHPFSLVKSNPGARRRQSPPQVRTCG